MDEQQMAALMRSIVREEIAQAIEAQNAELKAYITAELERNNLAVGDIVTEAAEKAVETANAHLDDQIDELKTVTADNCYQITLLKHKA